MVLLLMYYSVMGIQLFYCIYVIGIGCIGVVYIEVLFWMGEVEDFLVFDFCVICVVMIVDIGEQDMNVVIDYVNLFKQCLQFCGVLVDKFNFQVIVLFVLDKQEFFEGFNWICEFFKLEYFCYYWNLNFEFYVLYKYVLFEVGNYFLCLVVKGIYVNVYYVGECLMDVVLCSFVDMVEQVQLFLMVFVLFSIVGGIGSGIVVDLVCYLLNFKFGCCILVIGVGQFFYVGDGEEVYNGVGQYIVFNEIDCMFDDDKNVGVIVVWGEFYCNFFMGGFFVVNLEYSWYCLIVYMMIGEKEVC